MNWCLGNPQKIWESIVGGAGELLENQKKDQVATKINFQGSIDGPDTNIGEVVVLVLQNAFIQAMRPTLDNEINLGKLAESEEQGKTGFFKSLFKSDKKKKIRIEAPFSTDEITIFLICHE